MTIYRMAHDITGGGEEGVQQFDVVADGIINAAMGTIRADLDADGEYSDAQVSFSSQSAWAANDSRSQLIFITTGMLAAGTLANAVAGGNVSISDMAVQVNQGERIWLHVNSVAGVTGRVQFLLFVNDRIDPRTQRRR